MKFGSYDRGEDDKYNCCNFVETPEIFAMQDILCFGIGPLDRDCNVIFFCDGKATTAQC